MEHELALDLAHEINDPELEARALGGLGDAEYARGRMISAHSSFSRCVELSRKHGFGRIEVANLSMIAHTQVYLNDLSGALATSAAAIELAARVGHPRAEIIAHNAATIRLLHERRFYDSENARGTPRKSDPVSRRAEI